MATLKNLTINDTGYLQLPTGATTARGGAGETKIQWTSSGYSVLLGSTPSGISNTQWVCPASVTSIRLLIVGAGGGGGGDVGGGAGGGGYIYNGNFTVTPGNTYTISIGSAGSGGTNTPTQGGSTVAFGLTAYGGAGGGSWSNTAPVGTPSSMGSGGGQTSNYSAAAHTPTTGQGNPGGLSGVNTANRYEYAGASGGGGAGAKGGDGVKVDASQTGVFEGEPTWGGASWKFRWLAGDTKNGYGGDGLANDISGTPTFYAGGGGSASDGSSYWGVGGKGGGGRGGNGGDNDATYYGGGGGGAGATGPGGNRGGNGYQGIVIISYGSVAGDMRHNTTTALPEILNAGGYQGIGQVYTTTTGTVSSATSSGYTIKTFTGPGTITFTSPANVEVLLVAGGGGGAGIGGGGGAGGFIYQSRYRINAGVYPVSVGTGGAGATGWTTADVGSGNPSQFATLEATGGGAGVMYYYPAAGGTSGGLAWPAEKGNGGSGGGGPGGHISPVYGGIYGGPGSTRSGTGNVCVIPGGSGVAGQGHPGGSGSHGNGSGFGSFPGPGTVYVGGGGGGAGSRGASIRSTDDFRTGGRALASSISGSQAFYAGGGGGGGHGPGAYQNYGAGNSPGGGGGGGQAGDYGGPGGSKPGTTGTSNTGGGGGGGTHPSPGVSGAGGPGVVIIRHL